MPLADQLTVARAASVVLVIALFQWDFDNHLYWATAVFAAAMATDQIDGWLARRQGHTSALGSMLDPVADKVLVLAMLIMVVGAGAFPAWMVALIVARELLVSGLRLAAIERGVVIPARDLSKLKTWAQAVAATIGGLAAAGRVERRRGLVGAPRRARVHARVRPRVRASRTAAAQRPRDQLVVGLLGGLEHTGSPPRGRL